MVEGVRVVAVVRVASVVAAVMLKAGCSLLDSFTCLVSVCWTVRGHILFLLCVHSVSFELPKREHKHGDDVFM